MNIIENLNWRYATKRMNGEAVSADKLNTILEAIRMAPTSFGLQPIKVVVVESKEIREKMKAVCYDQPQITESACMLVFTVWTDNYPKKTDEFIELIAETRNQTLESLKDYKDRILYSVLSGDNVAWATRQAYIALGFGLSTAAMLNVDTTPMEGFIPEELDKILGLEVLGLKSVVMMAIGNRDEKTDYLVNLPKVRKSKEEFFISL